MDSEMMRALLAVLLRGHDFARGQLFLETDDFYLGRAQQILESSYRNYPSPVAKLDQ